MPDAGPKPPVDVTYDITTAEPLYRLPGSVPAPAPRRRWSRSDAKWGSLAWILLVVQAYSVQSAYEALDDLNPQTGQAGATLLVGLGAGAGATFLGRRIRPPWSRRKSAIVGAVVGLALGLLLVPTIGFAPATGGIKLSLTWFLPIAFFELILGPLFVLLTIPRHAAGRWGRGLGKFTVGVGVASFVSAGLVGLYMLVFLQNLADEAHAAHTHDTPGIGLLLVLLGCTAAILLGRRLRPAD